MKGKMYLWRGSCINEGERMYLWKGRCIYEGEDAFMKGKMYLWRGRCIYEGEDVFMKGEKNPGIFEEIENKTLFKNKRNPWNFSSQTVNKFRQFLKEKSQRYVWESVLAKIPGIFEPFATARFNNSKGKRRCAGCRFVSRRSRCPDFHQKIPEFYEEW